MGSGCGFLLHRQNVINVASVSKISRIIFILKVAGLELSMIRILARIMHGFGLYKISVHRERLENRVDQITKRAMGSDL